MKKYLLGVFIVSTMVLHTHADPLSDGLHQLKMKLNNLNAAFKEVLAVKNISLIDVLNDILVLVSEVNNLYNNELLEAIGTYRTIGDFKSEVAFNESFEKLVDKIDDIIILVDQLEKLKSTKNEDRHVVALVLSGLINTVQIIKEKLLLNNIDFSSLFSKAEERINHQYLRLESLVDAISKTFNIQIRALQRK